MSFFENKRVSGKNVIRSSLQTNHSMAGDVKRWLTRKIMFPAIYHFYALRPIKQNKVIFLEIRFSELTDSYEQIFNELVKNYKMDIHCHFFQLGIVTKSMELKKQIDFVKDAATAKYLVYNDSIDVQGCFKVRKGTKVLNTWHAAGAFKKFGLSTINKIYGGTAKERTSYRLHPDYDMVTVSSPDVAWAYIEAMGMDKHPECVQPVGISRSDVFYQKDFIDAAFNHLYDVLPQAKGKKIILYAPTFRGTPRKAITPDMLQIGAFYEHFHEDYILIFKHHPMVRLKPTIPTDYSKFAVDLTDLMSISELLCVSDICITDYSSLIFEFSLFERPMLFFAYDLANYFDWRGFYYNFDELTPGPVCYTNSEMIDYIENIEERFDKEKVHAFRERFMSSCDGHVTERIIKEFFGPEMEAFRRDTPLEGDYHTLPEVNGLPRDRDKRFDKMMKVMKIGQKAYAKAAKKPVIENRIALLAAEGVDWDVFLGLEKALKQSGREYDIIRDITFNEKNTPGFMEKLAGASLVVCAGEPYIMRMIKLRAETKLMQICPELLPIYPRWINSKEVRSGYNVRECENFPINSAYDAILGGAKQDNELFGRNYKLTENGSIYNVGNIVTDLLFDDEFKANARKRLDTICPYATGKKVILFLCKDRDPLAVYLSNVMTQLHEEFARDSVCVGFACDGRPGRKMEISEYLEGFGFDPRYVLAQRVAQQDADALDSDELPDEAAGARMDKINWKKFPPLTVMEAISCADVVVGDYTSYMLAAAVCKKPLFLWAPDRVTYGREQEMYLDYEELLPGISCSNGHELVKKIKNIDNYDMSILDKFRERFFSDCDGHASERTEKIVKDIMKIS
ncbi:CDP-glycerol glycerophosphotransferase family protein [Butyrivibrio sp. AE3006]|uniref:CDP-glycerol glycerophosphotransferase family protein n=1 Tax=Butyrivibrio sp. AE3006 TaxID=1280673 RepID=UPI0004120A7D|nr:CDP-glycerol glycerophosphotransferase family protein [Butyrivibrio sp. AE3006]